MSQNEHETDDEQTRKTMNERRIDGLEATIYHREALTVDIEEDVYEMRREVDNFVKEIDELRVEVAQLKSEVRGTDFLTEYNEYIDVEKEDVEIID